MSTGDNDLIIAVKNGDKNAFKSLYLRYFDLLFAFILHNTGNDRYVASEIWQETWIIAVEKIDDFKFKSTFFTWLCAISKNKIYDYYRKNKKQEQVVSIEEKHFDIDSGETDDELIDEMTRADVITTLSDMNENYRNVLVAKYVENKSIDEITALTGKSYKATESTLWRAKESFRKKFSRLNNHKR